MASVEPPACKGTHQPSTVTGPSHGRGVGFTLSVERDYLDWLENQRRTRWQYHGRGRRLARFGGVLGAAVAILSMLKLM